jgi:hypothetical protein
VELLYWIECIYVFRLEREHGTPKQERTERTEDERSKEDDKLDQGSMVVTHAHTTN